MSADDLPAEVLNNGPRQPGVGMAVRKRRWPWIALTAVVLTVAAVGISGFLVYQDAMRARDSLQVAADALPQVATQIRSDPQRADATIARVQMAAHSALEATTGPHWTVAGWLPWVGDNTRALQTVTTAVDRIASGVLPELAATVQSVTPERLAPQDGKLNLAPLVEVRERVVDADQIVGQAITDVSGIPSANLIDQLADAVARLQQELTDARALTSTASAAVQLLPAMLGADGPRDWLLLAQNNAESRATGGIPGAAILLHADNGRLSIVKQLGAGDFGPYPEPILPLTADESRLFGAALGHYLQDVNLTPDFPRSGQLVRAIWAADGGASDVANVVSLDPVALQTILRATGPVQFTDPRGHAITLDADNTASFLMSEVYRRFDSPDAQDAVFALAAQAVLQQVMSGEADAGELLGAVTEIAGNGRLLVWSADASEQQLLETIGVTGALRGSIKAGEGTRPVVGVFLNLTTASKLGYYLDLNAEIGEAKARPDGSREFDVTVRLKSRLTPAEARRLPSHVIENAPRDGTNRVNVLVYAPTDGTITQLSTASPGFVTTHDGLQVSAQTVTVPPESAAEVRFHIVTGPGQDAEPYLRQTPGARNA